MDSTHNNSIPLSITALLTDETRRRLSIGGRWLLLTALMVLVAVLGFIVQMQPSAADTLHVVFYLCLSGLFALVLGQAALWWMDATHISGMWLKLAIPPLLTALVISFSVVLIERLMFISAHDGQLLLIFLAFGAAVALVLATSIAGEMTRTIRRIRASASRIATGDYSCRIDPSLTGGAQELAELAQAFNHMATSVQDAFTQREIAEAERKQVIAAVSHDLRTPLASVRAMIEAIDEGVVADQETVRRYQHSIHVELSHLTALIDDLFELSRLESGALALRRARLSVEDVVSAALEVTTSLAEQAHIHLHGWVEEDLPAVYVDARHIQRVLDNLLQNALRHTGPGGAVLIRAARLGQPVEDHLLVQVIDNGSGVATDDLPHIFERTYRGETARQREPAAPACGVRAGLGLAIARAIVEAHGGRIWADSPLTQQQRAELVASACASPSVENDCPGTALSFTLPIASRQS
jgi:signal transduction histidine kinase